MKEYISTHSRIQGCTGSERCRNAVIENTSLLEQILSEAEKIELSQNNSKEDENKIPSHHFFSASASFCSNACSRPQIADFGIIAASIVNVTEIKCTGCNACLESCRENAIEFLAPSKPEIIREKCLYCGSCASVCPTGTLESVKAGYRIFLGGRMGRHPQLAVELPYIYDRDNVIELFKVCFGIYNDLFYLELRFIEMISRYPEKVPLSLRDMFITAPRGESLIKSNTVESFRSDIISEKNYR